MQNDDIVNQLGHLNGFITIPQVIQVTKITTRQGAYVAVNRLVAQNHLRP